MNSIATTAEQTTISKIPFQVIIIGIVSFCFNASTAMVFGVSALYMTNIVKVGIEWIGLLEGVVEGISYVSKLLSGVISDHFRKRRAIMIVGCSMMALARPIFAISASYMTVFTARAMDRLGNGIQSTPRDALVTDVAPHEIRGASVGLRQALAAFGSFVGGVVAYIVMRKSHNDYNMVFWISAVPALLAVVMIILFVREPKHPVVDEPETRHHTSGRPKRGWHHVYNDMFRLGAVYWGVIGVAALFMLARVTEAFLVLHAHKNFNLLEENAPLVIAVYNAAYSFMSYPVGILSDRIKRYRVMALGFVLLIAASLTMAWADTLTMALAGTILWGVQLAISQSMAISLIGDVVPADLRGTGFGVFYLVSAISATISSLVAGLLSKEFGTWGAFYFTGISAAAALVFLMWLRPQQRTHATL